MAVTFPLLSVASRVEGSEAMVRLVKKPETALSIEEKRLVDVAFAVVMF